MKKRPIRKNKIIISLPKITKKDNGKQIIIRNETPYPVIIEVNGSEIIEEPK